MKLALILILLNMVAFYAINTKLKRRNKIGFLARWGNKHFPVTFDNAGCQALWVARNPNYLQRLETPANSGKYLNRTPVPLATCIQRFADLPVLIVSENLRISQNNVNWIDCRWTSNTAANVALNDANLAAGTWNCVLGASIITVRVSGDENIKHLENH